MNSTQRRKYDRQFRFHVGVPPLDLDDEECDIQYDLMDQWCTDTFGRKNWNYVCAESSFGYTTYRFTSEKNAVWFKLRWA